MNMTVTDTTTREVDRLGEPVLDKIRDRFLAVVETATVGEALRHVRDSDLPKGQSALVFATAPDGTYKGFVRLSTLIRSEESAPVAGLLEGGGLSVPVGTDQEQAARKLQKHDTALLPVVDDDARMVGVLTFDDAMDILEVETSDDIYYKAGIGDLLKTQDHIRSERLTQGPIWYTVRLRMSFLLITLVGGLIVGGLIDTFEDVLGAVVALAIFIPLVMDMGGNVGTQSSTIFARGFALGHIRAEDFWRSAFAREALVGLAMAVVIALVAGTVAHFWQGRPNDIPQLGIVVGVALFTSVFTAAMLGFLMPYMLVKLGADHAPGADPFITTIKDFTGLLVYFLMASWLLGVSG